MLENAEKGYEEWLLSEMQRYVSSVSAQSSQPSKLISFTTFVC